MINEHETVAEALDKYNDERQKLLCKENNFEVLWRVVVAADNLANIVAWWEE